MCLPHGALSRDPSHQPPPSPTTKTCLHAAAIWVQLYQPEDLSGVLKFLFKRSLGKKGDQDPFKTEGTGVMENKTPGQGNLAP